SSTAASARAVARSLWVRWAHSMQADAASRRAAAQASSLGPTWSSESARAPAATTVRSSAYAASSRVRPVSTATVLPHGVALLGHALRQLCVGVVEDVLQPGLGKRVHRRDGCLQLGRQLLLPGYAALVIEHTS